MRYAKAAEAVDVDRRTVWDWMQLPAFQEESRKVREEVAKAAKEHIQAQLLRAAEVDSEAMEAMKPLYLKDGEGFAPVEDVPDHAIRLRAAHDVLDRAGVPRKVEAVSDDPDKALAAALASALRDLNDRRG